ncbi:MAG TPA: hypothetical protein VGM39_08145 [Kofleriaceae bacterium]|jgi:hypothetical protein
MKKRDIALIAVIAAGVATAIPFGIRLIRRLRASREELIPDLDTSTKRPGEPISRPKPSPLMH